jgi:hypothetical protein
MELRFFVWFTVLEILLRYCVAKELSEPDSARKAAQKSKTVP